MKQVFNKNAYIQFTGKLNYFLALAVAFTSVMPSKVFNFFWTAWLISWLIQGRFLSKSNFKFDKSKYPVIFFALFYVLQLISLLWADNVQSGLNSLQRQFSFIGVVPIALWGVSEHYKTRSIIFSLVAGILVSMILYYITMLYVYNYPYFVSGGDSTLWRGFSLDYFQRWGSLVKHRLYYCVVIVTGVISLFLIKGHLKKRYGNIVSTLLLVGTGILMISMVFFTGSRSTILALVFLVYVGILRIINKKYKALIVIATLILFSTSIFLLFKYHPRMNNFSLKDIEAFETGKTDNPLIEPRILIWHAVIENFNDYYLIGKGVGNSTDYLITKYKEYNYPEDYWLRRYNPHNQYFSAVMELGILGAVFLIAIFLFYFTFFTGKAKLFALFYSSLVGISLFTEGMFGRVDGVLTICFFNLFCIWLQQQPDNEFKVIQKPIKK